MPDNGPERIALGEFFIEGSRLKGQKDTKKIGDRIVYFKIIRIYNDGRNYEYEQVFDVLEEEK